MHYARLTPEAFTALHAELRDPDQIVLPDGGAVFHVGRHPEYERVVIVLDGERYGMLASRPASGSASLGHLSNAMSDGGPEWASLMALGGMLCSAG